MMESITRKESLQISDGIMEEAEEERQRVQMLLGQCEQLEAENRALKNTMEIEYIERQAKHIQELVAENQVLKAKLLRLEGHHD